MNVFDFDKTIFPFDSSSLFIKYCFGKYSKHFIQALPQIVSAAAKYKYAGNRGDATDLKEKLFSFLSLVSDPDELVCEFWERNIGKIHSWYTEIRKPDDVVISASPEFLLAPVQKEFGFQLIATRMDKYSGKISGSNCHDFEKVRRFYESYPYGRIDRFYSDSISDDPLASISKQAYMVHGKKIVKWPGKSDNV